MIHSSFAVRGGAERYVRDLSGDLLARGHAVRVFCRASPHREALDVHVAERACARLGARFPRLDRVATHLGDLVDPTGLTVGDLRDFAPDVVHVHNWQGLGALPLARIARHYPTCQTVHDYALCDPNNALANRGRSTPGDALLRLRSAWLVRRFRRFSLLWPAARTRDIVNAQVPRSAGIAGSVVPLAVPTETVPARAVPTRALSAPAVSAPVVSAADVVPSAGQPSGGTGGRQVFLFLGALSTHKGVPLLLDAWRDIASATGGRLLIAGDGPLRDRVEAFAAEHGSVRYLGFLDEAGKQAAMREAGWLVLASQWVENFPISCVEALRAGRPIISSAVARPPMAADGSVLTFDTRADLGRVFRQAAHMRDDEYRQMCSSAAADGRLLDWDGHVDAVVDTYRTLLAARTRTRPGRHP